MLSSPGSIVPRSSTCIRRIGVGRGLAASAALVALFAACGEPAPQLAVRPEAESAPRVVALDPPQGALDVDPSLTALAVTFDRPMDPEGWAWVIEDPSSAPEIGESAWDPEVRRQTVPVKLQPGKSYVLWINSAEHAYFRDRDGRTVAPLRWSFSTRGAGPSTTASVPGSGGPGAPVAPIAAHRTSASGIGSSAPVVPPQVVELDPPQGAVGVDPTKTLLRARFDRPMEGSWAWVTEGGDSFPEMAGQGYFEPDRVTAALPVRLQPGRTYVVWLNSEQHLLFRDTAGVPATPLRWTFTTRAQSPG